MIDARAVIDPQARIGKGVKVGPYAVIGPDVEIGDDCEVGPHVVIDGPTRIGNRNHIFPFSAVGAIPQDLKFHGEVTRLEIGDDNTIRESCTISRGTEGGGGVTRIGDHNLFMAYVHIAHDCQVGNHAIFANCASLAGHVTVDDYAILGGFTGVHQFCHVGAHVMTAIATVVLMDVPPFLLISGNPATPHGLNVTGLKRRGFSGDVVGALRAAYKTVFRSGLRLEEAIHRLREDPGCTGEVAEFARFLTTSERGIIR